MLAALQFQHPQGQPLQSMTNSEWHDLFCRWEISRLLIPLRQTCGDMLPEWVRSRIDQNLADNRERFERIKQAYSDFALASEERGAEHVVIKGFAQCPDFVEHPRLRLQSDIDLYCPPESISKALDALRDLGYQPDDRGSADHLPAMIPPTPWTWRGNPYDPAIPVSFELHFCFWNERFSKLRPKGLDQFWLRRVERWLDGMHFPALAPVDNVAYSALNLLRDTLSNAMTPHLVYELARFLDTNAGNESLWEAWQELHDDSLRRLEALSFRLASHCFGCRLAEPVRRQIDDQPAAVKQWFQQFADSPLAASFHPNKDALWLHMSMLESSRDKRAVLLRRLFPTQLPPLQARHIQKTAGPEKTSGGTVRKWRRYVAHMGGRTVYHLGILPRTVWHGVRWRCSRAELGRDFLTFLAVSFLFNLGMYVFFLLYNLYLLDRGFRENFLGTVAGAVTLGGVAGTLPAGVLVQRLGLQKALLICLGLVSLISALRVVFASAVPLVVLSFLGGFALVIWAVALSPTIAELTTEKSRTFGFTGVFFFGIAVGILGGQLGGRLPGWLVQLSPSLTPPRAKETALLLASGLVALAILPASRLGLKAKPVRGRETYSSSPFLLRFLVAIAVWSVAIGGFSPFFSVYFSRYWQMPLKQIGMVDAISRIAQLLAILTSPALFKKFGLVPGMAYAQLATAITLACLASAPGPSAARALFIGYVAFQWMCEPAVFTVLMNHVELKDRAGASALAFLVINASQAVASVVAGVSYVRFGYPTVIAGTAIVGLAAATLFRLLLGKETVLSPEGSQVSSGP
jgi:predicted MFS family arabinose efflux permease